MSRARFKARDLGIDVASGREREIFKWFLASFLGGKRISQEIAANTYGVLVHEHGLDTPAKLCRCPRQRLVRLLGEGRYTRYDESTATRLHALCRKLREDYGGRLGHLRREAGSRAQTRARLLAFDGVGPKTADIFLREVGPVWF
ncbi:MAG: DNA methylase [Sinimarinibacterium flocculans]|uniref:DNA methylase n=1 Tax=Sinimarinibacterium flocculans TaxID=985250 RepID=UPI003C658BFE